MEQYLNELQWVAFACNMLFIWLLTANKKLAWPFGIIASAILIYVFYQSRLVSESFLQVFYVIMGFYGWMYWSRKQENEKKGVPIVEFQVFDHVVLIAGSVGLALLMGKLNEINPYAALPYADAFSTAFAFTATFLEARKVLSGWIYWIIINLYSIWLYGQKTMDTHDLTVMQIQMGVFTLFSIVGFIVWRKNWNGKTVRMARSKPAQ